MVAVTCRRDRRASSWPSAAPVRSAAAPAAAAALPSRAGSAPAPAAFPARCAFAPSPVSPSPSALCQDAAFEIPVVLAPSGASAFHPAREWPEDVVLVLVALSL